MFSLTFPWLQVHLRSTTYIWFLFCILWGNWKFLLEKFLWQMRKKWLAGQNGILCLERKQRSFKQRINNFNAKLRLCNFNSFSFHLNRELSLKVNGISWHAQRRSRVRSHFVHHKGRNRIGWRTLIFHKTQLQSTVEWNVQSSYSLSLLANYSCAKWININFILLTELTATL